MIFLDTNIVIDLLEPETRWHGWSRERVETAEPGLAVGPIVLAETAPRFPDLNAALAVFARLDIEIVDLPSEAAFAAGRAFLRYRRGGTERQKILADFLIGSHADHLGASLMTRDARIYRAYFPELSLITPETDHD